VTFDGAALAAVGWWSGRLVLVLLGVVCFISAGLVVLYWRWYRRRLDDIALLQRGLADESRELGRFLRER